MAGGIDWFRWHHGSVTDPKFALVARRAGTTLPNVLAVWAYVLEKASASEHRGEFGDLDDEAIDCLFGLDDGTTAAILEHMQARDLIDDTSVKAWEKRQPKRERDADETAAERKAAQRAREAEARAAAAKAAQVTPAKDLSRHVTPSHASENQVTPRGEESREEQEKEKEKPLRASRSAPLPCPEDVDAQVWVDWLQLRKSKKAPVTLTTLDGARSEAGKAGMTLEAFLRVWCRRGSQGLEAAWLKPDERNTDRPVETTYQRSMRERVEQMTGGLVSARPPNPIKTGNVIDMEPTGAEFLRIGGR